jgi:hypothetical protein
VPHGLEEVEMVFGDRQDGADDDQTYRVGKSNAPERHGGQRREQQKLEDADERDHDAAFIHRGTLGVTGDGVDPAGRS